MYLLILWALPSRLHEDNNNIKEMTNGSGRAIMMMTNDSDRAIMAMTKSVVMVVV